MSPDDIGKTVAALVSRLPTGAARLLYGELAGAGEANAKVAVVRRALVERINASRQQHGRRLFTQLFEPFITADMEMLRPGHSGIGVLHTVDIGAVWTQAAAGPLAKLAAEIEAKLPSLVAERPLDLVLSLPEIQGLQEQARRGVLEWLTGDAARLHKVLAALNNWRAAELRRMGADFTPRSLTTEDLITLRGALIHGASLRPIAQAVLADSGSAETMVELAGSFALHPIQSLTTPEARMAAYLVPLSLLHRRRAYRSVVPFLLDGSPAVQARILEAMDSHFARICARIGKEAGMLAGAGQPIKGPLAATTLRRLVLGEELGHLDAILSIYEEFEILDDPRLGAQARDYMDQMVKAVERTLYPALIDRCIAAGRAVERALPDQDALEWALGLCVRWRTVIGRVMHWGTGHSNFKEQVLELAKAGFQSALSDPRALSPPDRLGQAVRMLQISKPLGGGAEGWITLLDKGLVRTVSDRLRQEDPLRDGERDLAAALMVLVRDELRRTRHWRDTGLVALDELALAAGL
ncbi:MAG: hypothetical protein ACT6Q8_14225 [Niveispirillum sp.]|uniref:hypothetical protein n=1 Tax=Niveispirillum sp. TaxID=1917217 RepID=UPI004036658A